MSKKLQNIGVVSLLTVVSRFLGLARDLLSAGIFGASVFMDAFVTAFALPNLFRRLLGEGALTAAFVPTLQEELNERDRAGAFALLNKVASWLVVVTGALVGLAMLVFSQSRWIGYKGEAWYLMADLSVILFPYLAFVCIAAVFSATLNVFGRFVEPALSPIWLNLAMIASLAGAGWNLADTELGRMHWLCAGVLAGGFLQMTVPGFVLMREGWRPRFDLRLSPRVREIGLLMAPGLFGTAVYQINVYVSRLFALSAGEASATAMFYANRLMELPIGVFAIAIATVIYPALARHAVERNFVGMASDYRKGLRLVLVINVPAAVGLALLSGPIVRFLYQRGNFSADDAALMSPLLALFAVGMPFFSVTSLTIRAFYAVKDTTTTVKMATVSFAVNLGLSLLLVGRLGALGLVVASTVAVVVQTLLLQRALAQRLPGMAFGELWTSLGKVGVATLAMTAVVAGGWHLMQQTWPDSRLTDAAAVFALIPLGIATYAAVLWAVRIEGRDELAALVTKFRAKLG